MLRAVRTVLGSRWPILGMGGAGAALVVAVWALIADGDVAQAATSALLGLALVGLVIVGSSAREAEKRARKIDGQLKALASSTESLAATAQAIAAKQDDPSGGPLAAIIGAQRLDAAVRHDEVLSRYDDLRSELVRTLPELQLAEYSALANLYSMMSPDDEVPVFGGFAAVPQTVLRLTSLVPRLPGDGLIVECGSGSSTVWLALACRRAGHGRVVALEHLERYAEKTRAALTRLGLDSIAEVRTAPLEPVRVGDQTYEWYDAEQWSDLKGIALLFVDGPPGSVGPRSRYPAFPLLASALADGGVVALDDIQRDDEADVAADWVDEGADGVALGEAETVGRTRFFTARRR